MRSFLPCKTLPQNQCDISHQAAGVLYDDMTNMHPRTLPQAPIEMLDVKRRKKWLGMGGYGGPGYPPAGYPVLGQPPVFICPPPLAQHQHYSQDLYNPVYEELSNCSETKRCESEGTSDFEQRGHCSEDDFAEDETSVVGIPLGQSQSQRERIGVLSDRDTLAGLKQRSPMSNKFKSWKEKEARSLERKRTKSRQGEPGFHEGLLLDALLQLYPNPVTQTQFPCILPLPPNHYDKILKPPGMHPDQTSLRQYNDSDSGYSHNTSEDHGSTIKGRNHSHYIPDSPSLLL